MAGKLTLPDAEQKSLLSGTVEITEKVDGANTGIVRGNGEKWILQKRRGLADTGVHEMFAFFWNWARANEEKILKIPSNWTVYGELMYAKHNVFYDMLPSYFLVFDVWNGEEYLNANERADLCLSLNFCHVPVLFLGHLEDDVQGYSHQLEQFVKQSSYSSNQLMEGIVVKNARKQMRGKLVRPEFMKQLEEEDHWLHQKLTRNQLRPGANAFD